MNENQLGKNIKWLRKVHGETLKDLGEWLHCEKTTIIGYENGSRKPDLDRLRSISVHYGATVDDLLYTDLSQYEATTAGLNSPSDLTMRFKIIFPLFCSESTMRSENFKKGYNLSERILDRMSKGEFITGNDVVEIWNCFSDAEDECDGPELKANWIWLYFMIWFGIQDVDKLTFIQDKMFSRKLTIKYMLRIKGETTEETKERRRSYVGDIGPMFMGKLKELKSDPKWADLADYYLALSYYYGIANTDLTLEASRSVGIQMMNAFAILGNKMAAKFFTYYL